MNFSTYNRSQKHQCVPFRCACQALLLLEAYFHISQVVFLSLWALYFLTHCPVHKHYVFICWSRTSPTSTRKINFHLCYFTTYAQRTGKTNLIPPDRKYAFKFVKHPLHIQHSINISSMLASPQKFSDLRDGAEKSRDYECRRHQLPSRRLTSFRKRSLKVQ